MTENPLLLKGFTSGWLQKFFNEPFDPLCVMLAMRTKLLLDVIDEMGHSYNLLRAIGYGFIDFGDIPDDLPGDPDNYYPPDINNPIIIPPPPGEPGTGLPGPIPPTPGQPGYGAPVRGQPGYIPPAEAPSIGQAPMAAFPTGAKAGVYRPALGRPSAGSGRGGGSMSTGGGGMGSAIGWPGYDIFPGKTGANDFGWGKLNCCYKNTDPTHLVTIGYTTLEMNCGDIQNLTVEDYNSACLPDRYTWSYQPAQGSLVPGDYEATYTAPEAGVDCETAQTIKLMCDEVEVDSIVITINACPATASIGYTTHQMNNDETQTLTAVPGAAGCGSAAFTWAITSGGGSLNTTEGDEVIYTAPSSNAGCTNNPTISLSCGGVVQDTITIAVNAYPNPNVGATTACCDFTQGPYHQSCTQSKGCSGVLLDLYYNSICETKCGYLIKNYFINNTCASASFDPGINDERSPALIAAGCCPAELL